MARPKKEGLEYYPKDTNTHGDRKIRRLISEHGGNGYLIYDYLIGVIYAEKGYWIRHDEHLSFDIADYLKVGIDENKVEDVIKCCIKVGLFDAEIYRNTRVLTSNGIQKRYIKVKKDGVIDAKLVVSSDEMPENEGETPQSKVKESKVNESREGDGENSPTLLSNRRRKFYDSLVPYIEKYGKEMLRKFYDHWSEPNRSGTKMNFEYKQTWDLEMRLRTWASREQTYQSMHKSHEQPKAQPVKTAQQIEQERQKRKNDGRI